MTTNFFTPFVTDETVDSAALNSRFSDHDTQITALAGGTGYSTQTANLVFAGPNTGSPAAPTFRALVAADLTSALASPPAIGGTTPAAGTFSTLRVTTDPGSGVSGQVTLTDVTDTPTTDPGWTTSSTVNMNAPDGYLKAYVGTQAVVIPFWNT